jgi:hypothetical protein
MLRCPPAWAVDAQDLATCERAGVSWVEVHDMETGTIYRALLSAFRKYGRELDRGCGRQVALSLGYWAQLAGKPERKAARQLALELP